jgi:hypothetical protein
MNLPLGPTEAELVAAKEVGAFALPSLWTVHQDYAVEGPRNRRRLGERGVIVRRYPPTTRLDLPTELARLAEADEEKVRVFARRYGLLGRAKMLDRRGNKGEPLDWVRGHASNVQLLLEGLRALKSSNEVAAREIIESLTTEHPGALIPLPVPTRLIAVRDRLFVQQWVFGTPGTHYEAKTERLGRGHVKMSLVRLPVKRRPRPINYVRAVASVMRDIIGPNIFDVRRQPFVTRDNTLSSDFASPALVEIAYWMILNTAQNESGKVERCEECESVFIATHGRQRFCPPCPGQRESSCALRHRQRRFSKKRGKR